MTMDCNTHLFPVYIDLRRCMLINKLKKHEIKMKKVVVEEMRGV